MRTGLRINTLKKASDDSACDIIVGLRTYHICLYIHAHHSLEHHKLNWYKLNWQVALRGVKVQDI